MKIYTYLYSNSCRWAEIQGIFDVYILTSFTPKHIFFKLCIEPILDSDAILSMLYILNKSAIQLWIMIWTYDQSEEKHGAL